MENKNEMMVFNNEEFGNVRVVRIDGECWFIGKDVAEALGYKNLSDSLCKHVTKEHKTKVSCMYLEGIGVKGFGTKGGIIIDSKGVIELIQKSKTMSTEYKRNFKNWLVYNGLIEDKFVFETRKEIDFLDRLENALIPFDIKGERQYNVLNYKIDYYIPSLNVAIEYDENAHKDYTYEQHELRQKLIEEELGCRFIRVTDNKDDYVNIGLVIKQLLKYGLLEVV